MKKIALATLVAVTVFMLTACSGVSAPKFPEPSTDVAASQAVLNQLADAQEVVLKKDAISWGDKWAVSVNGNKVADVKGEAFPVLGDTYVMTNLDGVLVGSESEKVFRFMRGATAYDYENVLRGEIEQNLTMFLQSYNIYGPDEKLVGSAEQKFSLTLQYEVKNRDGVAEYEVKRDTFSWGANVTVTRLVSSPMVDVQDVVWVALLTNEVYEAQQEEN